MIAVPIIVIWVISLPSLALFLLYKHHSKKESKIKQYFLILYQGLKQDKFYWEFMNTAKKILILMTFPLSTNMKLFSSTFLLVAFTRLQNWLQPYKEERNNEVEILASAAGIVTISSGLMFSSEDSNDSLNVVVFVIVILFNTIFFLDWIYLLANYFKESSKTALKVIIPNLIIFRFSISLVSCYARRIKELILKYKKRF